MNSDRIYIVTCEKDVQTLISLCQIKPIKGSSVYFDMLQTYNRRKANITGAYFIPNGTDRWFRFYESTTERNYIRLVETNHQQINVNQLSKRPIYVAYQNLQLLMNEIERIKKNTFETDYLSHMSLDQAIVDYILKLEVIGSDRELFETMVNRDDAWITEFFQPLADIVNQIGLEKDGKNNRKIAHANQRLDQLVSWSSPKIEPLDDIMQKEPIKLTNYAFFDKDFHESQQETRSSLDDELTKDKQRLNNLLN